MDDGNEVTLADTDTGLNKQMAKCCLKLFELFSRMPPDHLSDVEGVISNTNFSKEGRPFCYPDDKLDQILARFEKCRTFEFEAEFGIDQDQLIVGTAAAVLKELRRNFDFTPFCSTLQLDFDTYRHLGALLPVVIDKCDPKTLVSELLCSPADCCVLLVIKYLELNGFNPVVNWKEIKFNLDEWSLDDIKSFNDAIDTGARQVLDGNRKNKEESKPTISQEKMESAISETHQMVESTPNKINQISAEITSTIKSMNITDLYNFRESLKKDREAEREEYSTLMKAQYLLRDEDIEKTRLQLEEAKREMENAKRLTNSVDSAYYGITDTFFNQLTLQVGDFVLARPDMNDLFPLLPAKVIEIDGDNSRYRVQIFETSIINSLTAQDIAIPRVTLCERFVEKTESGSGNDDRMCKYRGAAAFVGLRVAALVKTSTSDKEEWMSGTVAAMPTAIHNNQFLVFFDADFDSYVNAPCYFEHPDVFKLFQYKFGEMTLDRFKEKLTIQKIVPMVSQSSYDDGSGVDRFNVHTLLRFNPSRAKFLKLYFERYPNYQLARFSKPGPNRPPDVTQYYQGGSKHEGFVIHVDRSMCVIRRKEGPCSPGIKCFDYPCRDVSHQHNDESLFRGSTRIAHINMLGDNNLSSRRKHEVYRRMEYIEPTVDIHSLTENRTQRKSTYLPTDKSRRPTSKKQDNAAELERKKKCENIYQVQHRLVDPQPIPSPHVGQCTNACLRGLDSDTYDKRWVYDSEGKFLCYSPLYIPLLCGYQRKIYTFGSVKVNRRTKKVKRSDVVMYHAPCGRPLRSMHDVTQFLKATHSELTIDLFNFDPTVDPGAYVTVDKKYYVGVDFTKDHEHIPIPYVNSVDKDKHPAEFDFIYSTRRFPYSDIVKLPTINREFCSGCSCEDDCSDPSKCECQQLTKNGVKRLTSSARPAEFGFAYRSLKGQTITGIYECNENCKCSTRRCHNRVAQNPVVYPQQLFKTATCGWGIRALVDIPKGAFIANYHGALLTTDLADQLQCDVYFADLDLKDSVEKCKVDEDCAMGFLDEAIGSSEGEQEDRPAQRRRRGSDDDDGVGSDLSDDQESTGQMRLRRKRKGTRRNYADDAGESDSSENAEQPKTTTRKIDNEDAIFLWDSYFTESESLFVLDAKDKGNIGRFYNHCCDPNIQTQHVLVDTHDLRLPWISFFACRNIQAGEELRWNYNYFKGESADADVEERLPCNCGAPSCDGVFRYTYQHSKNDAPEATDETQYPRRTNQRSFENPFV